MASRGLNQEHVEEALQPEEQVQTPEVTVELEIDEEDEKAIHEVSVATTAADVGTQSTQYVPAPDPLNTLEEDIDLPDVVRDLYQQLLAKAKKETDEKKRNELVQTLKQLKQLARARTASESISTSAPVQTIQNESVERKEEAKPEVLPVADRTPEQLNASPVEIHQYPGYNYSQLWNAEQALAMSSLVNPMFSCQTPTISPEMILAQPLSLLAMQQAVSYVPAMPMVNPMINPLLMQNPVMMPNLMVVPPISQTALIPQPLVQPIINTVSIPTTHATTVQPMAELVAGAGAGAPAPAPALAHPPFPACPIPPHHPHPPSTVPVSEPQPTLYSAANPPPVIHQQRYDRGGHYQGDQFGHRFENQYRDQRGGRNGGYRGRRGRHYIPPHRR